jgi:glycosyltransferase involved in cell wall biosynthesis
MLLMGKPLRVLWQSNSPAIGTGYGNQTDLFTRAIKKRGHDVFIRGFWGQHGSVIGHGEIPVWPMSHDDLSQDTFVYDWQRHKPDVMVLLYDIWAYKPEHLDRLPITSYAPIDHQPAPPAVVDRLRHCKWIWAMSRFGEREMRKAGLDPFYVPHVVDTEVYKPIDRIDSRRKWGIAEDKFVVAVNAANKGYPSRKNLDKILKAWSLFIQKHPQSLLYVHTNASAVYNGYNLVAMTEFYGIPDDSIRFPDQHKLRDGEITAPMLNAMYNAADVFLLPSQGEGFGIPVLEAQASGCPVIVTDFTAQSELCGGGWKIPVDRIDDLYYTPQGSEQAWIRPSAIITALETAYESRGDDNLRTQAREFAMDYEVEYVTDRYTMPSLKTMAQGNADLRLMSQQAVA